MLFHVRALRWLVSLLLPLPLLAATWRVNNTPGSLADHSTIQAAINAAANGDTILVEGSAIKYQTFTLRDKRLNIIGPGYRVGANLGTPANKLGAVINDLICYIENTTSTPETGSVSGSLIMGFEFVGDLEVRSMATGVTIARCYFGGRRPRVFGTDITFTQCFFSSSGSAMDITPTSTGLRVENCLMPEATIQFSSLLYPPVPSFHFSNNLMRQPPSLPSGSMVTLDNNIFLNSSSSLNLGVIARNNLFFGTVPTNIVGTGNLAYDSPTVVMANFNSSAATFDSRYQLVASLAAGPVNPAFNGGVDGTHIGPFGGANPYILSGVPPLPTIDELTVPQFATPGGELVIRVKVSERP